MQNWAESGRMFDNFDVTPDQIGGAYNRRWVDVTSKEKRVVEVSFYVMSSPTGGYDVWEQIDTTLCTDVRDVGSTEIWSNGYPPQVVVRGLRNPGVARQRAGRLAAGYSSSDIDWDGATY